MIKAIRNILLLSVFTAVCLTFVSCSDDDGGGGGLPDDVEGTLLGTWTNGTATLNSFTINGEDISEFFANLGLSEEAIEEIEASFTDGFTDTFEGSITFEADGSYEATDTQESFTGTWELTNDDTVLLLDKDTEDEVAISLVSLSDSEFEGVIEVEETEDLDQDGTSDTFAIKITITLTR